ncbi:PQQ-binding-like beta-propeller repeat protein [Flexithrix dorotheae]|uniref:outer membrane protein assembly factor BamB family protein n=1 Tax=Flexithrix dorotheae TaxID=70993 RepID=UPI0012F9936C|nr:PQQ-binding-like beta-propeller repeat protein [Flexithrix dorotheae]
MKLKNHLLSVTNYSVCLFFLMGIYACSTITHEEESVRENKNEWPAYQGDKGRNQYSNLKQINKENVTSLKVAWEYKTNDLDPDGHAQIQCNPIIIDGIMYGTSPRLKVFAINAATGEEKWVFNPNANAEGEKMNYGMNVNRGVTYWEKGNDKRILFTSGPVLYCLNADTGQPVKSFGIDGQTSLKQNLGGRSADLYVVSTTPGVAFNDLLIIGTRVSENVDAASGYIRAFNIKTGEVAWTFHTIPKPGEFGFDTWPEDAHNSIGGANSWSGMSLDEKRGIVFIPTGSAAFDFYGGNRKGENLFANCVLALNASTGERIWHYQTVHHDVWDRDLPAPPNLITVNHNGKEIDAVAQITKSGFVFLFNRETGEPLFPIEEKPFPKSDLEGEETWPTQPIPTLPPPFARQQMKEGDITNISQESHDYVRGILANVRSDGQFVPPSKEGTIIYPGFDGGGEWGGASFDQQSGIMYVNANEMAWILTMVEVGKDKKVSEDGGKELLADAGASIYQVNCAICHGQERQGDPSGTYPPLKNIGEKYKKAEILALVNSGKGFMPSFGHLEDGQKEALLAFLLNLEDEVTDAHELGMESNKTALPYTHTGYNRFFDHLGYPAVKPPWGTLNAIDLNKGEILWKVPLGEFEELTDKGIAKTGTENYGGPVATDGGLIFIGASKDEYFRAFDKDTGEELWKYKLPAGGYATPAVYEADGKQYVVIACGGGKMGTKSGDSYVAFALP